MYKIKFCINILFIALTFSITGHCLEIDDHVPNVILKSIQEQKDIELSSLNNKVVYVDFWASWCGPCRESLPKLNTLYQELKSHGFEVYSINVDERPEDALYFLEKHPVDYAVVHDPRGRTPLLFGVKGMPTAYLFDTNGKLNYIHQGFRKGDIEKVRDHVLQLLKK